MRVVVQQPAKGQRSLFPCERVAVVADDHDTARAVAFVFAMASSKGTLTAVETDNGETLSLYVSERAQRFKRASRAT